MSIVICGKSFVTTFPDAHVDDGRHRDPLGVLRVTGEEGLLQPLDAQHRVATAGVEVEGPRPLVVGRAGQAEGQRVLQAEQPPHDDRAVRPRAGPGRDQPVPTRLDRPVPGPVVAAHAEAVLADRAVGGDPVGDVVGVAVEVALTRDVPAAALAVLTPCGDGFTQAQARRPRKAIVRVVSSAPAGGSTSAPNPPGLRARSLELLHLRPDPGQLGRRAPGRPPRRPSRGPSPCTTRSTQWNRPIVAPMLAVPIRPSTTRPARSGSSSRAWTASRVACHAAGRVVRGVRPGRQRAPRRPRRSRAGTARRGRRRRGRSTPRTGSVTPSGRPGRRRRPR